MTTAILEALIVVATAVMIRLMSSNLISIRSQMEQLPCMERSRVGICRLIVLCA